MVQRFKPVIEKEFGYNEWEDIIEAVMKESLDGQWVKLSTYKDEVARLNKIIEKKSKMSKADYEFSELYLQGQ